MRDEDLVREIWVGCVGLRWAVGAASTARLKGRALKGGWEVVRERVV